MDLRWNLPLPTPFIESLIAVPVAHESTIPYIVLPPLPIEHHLKLFRYRRDHESTDMGIVAHQALMLFNYRLVKMWSRR